MRVMVRAFCIACVGMLGACRFAGTESSYGVSEHKQQFGEVQFVLEEAEGSQIKNLPFLVFGSGELPPEYDPRGQSYERVSVGDKVRLPLPLRALDGRLVVYLEGGGMVSYYQADAIGTPVELEGIVGAGAQLELGDGWWVNFAVRTRKPLGNGHRHDHPEHAPPDAQLELILGVRKDF